MTSIATLRAIDAARNVLGLKFEEIAAAVETDESTLDLWRQGKNLTAVYRSRLNQLNELANEIQKTMKSDSIDEWLRSPVPNFDSRSPREMIIAGRAESVRGALASLNYGFGG